MTKTSSANERDRDVGGEEPRILSIRLDSVQIGDNRRTCNEEAVNDLAVSMRDIGLINPVSVARKGKNKEGKNTYLLIGGYHRLKAADLNGWEKINAIVLKGDDDELRLCEIAENIFRNDPTVLESADLITEYVEIVNRKGGHIAHPGGVQPHDKGISQAAKDLHISRERVRRAKTIAAISKAAKEEVKKAKLSNSQKYLLQVANLETPDEQVAKIKEIVKNKATPKKKPEKTKPEESPSPSIVSEADMLQEAKDIHTRDGDFEYLKDAWEKAPKFVTAWTNASLLARDLFIEKVLRPAPTKSPAKAEGADGHE